MDIGDDLNLHHNDIDNVCLKGKTGYESTHEREIWYDQSYKLPAIFDGDKKVILADNAKKENNLPVAPTNPETYFLNANKEWAEIQIGHNQLSDLNGDNDYLHVTSGEKSTWSGKQDALTFSTDIETDKASTTKISAIKTLYDWAVGKFIDLTKIVTTWTATTLDTNIPSEKLVKDNLDLKADITHNHNLNDLAEKSYNSLTDTPSLDFEPANDNIQLHIGDGDIHVTTGKTNAWDAKLDVFTFIPFLDTIDKMLTPAINEVNAIAKGAGNGETVTDIAALVTLLNNALPTDYPYGKNFYVVDTEVPDFWISAIGSSSVPYAYIDDTTFLDDIAVTGSLQVGYYSISELETQKVNLTDYYDKNAADLLLGAKANLSGGNSISGNQNFDSNTLFVDSVNHRVGVGNNAPTKSFHVSGDIINTGNYISSANEIQIQMSSGYYTVFRGVRAEVSWIDSKNTQWFQIGNEYDYVAFTSKSGTPIKRYGIFASTTQISPTYGANVPTGLFEISDKTNPLFNVLLNGNVGIGTTTPAAKLDVNGTSNFADNMNILSTKNQYLAASPTADTVNDIRVRNDSGVLKTERCTVANATKGGGTWVDESKADITPATGATSALRALYIARSWNRAANGGAERYELTYNANTGYYEMYGITNLTEADIVNAYIASQQLLTISWIGAFACRKARVNFPIGHFIAAGNVFPMKYIATGNIYLEKFIIDGYYNEVVSNNCGVAFSGCSSLNEFRTLKCSSLTSTDLVSNMFLGCTSLVTCYLRLVKISFSFESSPLLSLASLQYLVTNRDNGTTRITITVHPTVWGYLNDAVNYPTWNALLVDAVANQYIDFASA